MKICPYARHASNNEREYAIVRTAEMLIQRHFFFFFFLKFEFIYKGCPLNV